MGAPPTDKAWHDPTEVAVKFECGLWEGSPNEVTTASYNGKAKSITEFVKNKQGQRINNLKVGSRVTSAEAKHVRVGLFSRKRVRAEGDTGKVLQIDLTRKDDKFVEVCWDMDKNGKEIKDPFTGWTKAT